MLSTATEYSEISIVKYLCVRAFSKYSVLLEMLRPNLSQFGGGVNSRDLCRAAYVRHRNWSRRPRAALVLYVLYH